MNPLDFDFEDSPWDICFRSLETGGGLSASRFLSLTEPLTEDGFADALESLDRKDILLDVSDLPRPSYTTQSDLRLKREEELVRQNALPGALEETDPLRLYLEELAMTPAFGDPDVVALEVLEGVSGAPDRLLNLMLSRVVQLSYAHAGKGVLLLDLIQEGSLGLWQAISQYRGGDIGSFCDRRILRSLTKLIVSQARANGIGRKLKRIMEDYRAVDERLLSELGRNPTLEEIALELHISPEEASAVADALNAARLVDKVSSPALQDSESADEDKAVEDTAYFQMRQRIRDLLSTLNSTDAEIISLRFGLEGGLPLTPEETGRRLGLTPEEVTKRETAALASLRPDK